MAIDNRCISRNLRQRFKGTSPYTVINDVSNLIAFAAKLLIRSIIITIIKLNRYNLLLDICSVDDLSILINISLEVVKSI